MNASLSTIVKFADTFLHTSEVHDYDGAYNGLQVENNNRITRIASAVDAHEKVIERAIHQGADLLLVHHGLFWNQPLPLTGINHRRIRLCIENNLAVYSSHLPLDFHPTIGNNVLLAKALGLKKIHPSFESKGQKIGVIGFCNEKRNIFAKKLENCLKGKVHLIAGGKDTIQRVGIITGGAGEYVTQAAEAGLDAFITGEGSHWTFGYALEHRINLFYGGHYATETFGVKKLAETLSKKFRVPWNFIDYPSGL